MRDSGNFDLLIWNVLAAHTGDPENYLYENLPEKAGVISPSPLIIFLIQVI